MEECPTAHGRSSDPSLLWRANVVSPRPLAVLAKPSAQTTRPWLDFLRDWLARHTPFRALLQITAQGVLYYGLTSFVAVFGVIVGHGLVIPCPNHPKPPDLASSFALWDGNWYRCLMEHGYTYDPARPSAVAFFPAFPLLGRLVATLTGLRPALALLLVSHLCLAGAFIVMAAYVRQRFPSATPHLGAYVLLGMGLFPTSFFFRLAYTESLFLLLAVLTLYGLERRWPLWILAILIGLATATRVPGVCLLAPFLLHIWRRSRSFAGFAGRLAWLTPMACWGLGGFMLYQLVAFGEPFAFAQAHGHWHLRPSVSWNEKLAALVTLEPLRSVFHPDSPGYWKWHTHVYQIPLVSLAAANPFLFLGTCGLLLWGAYQRWLSAAELLLAAALLAASYGGRGYQMCMVSMGRFMAVVFPTYLVLGNLFSRWPAPVVMGLLAVSGAFVFLYAALFASGYPLL